MSSNTLQGPREPTSSTRSLMAAVLVVSIATSCCMGVMLPTIDDILPLAVTRNNLSAMRTTQLQMASQTLRTWIAESSAERALGLSYVQSSEMAADQGMLFVYLQDTTIGFQTSTTSIALDIAFISSSGTIIDIQAMAPLSSVRHESPAPFRFALEVKQGTFAQWGVYTGQTITIPWSVLNSADIHSDNHVNVGDLQLLVAAWNSQVTPLTANWNPNADLNRDSYVNTSDLQLLVANWGRSIN